MLDLESMNVLHYRRSELKPTPVGLSLLRDSAQLAGAFVSKSIRVATRRVGSTHEIIHFSVCRQHPVGIRTARVGRRGSRSG